MKFALVVAMVCLLSGCDFLAQNPYYGGKTFTIKRLNQSGNVISTYNHARIVQSVRGEVDFYTQENDYKELHGELDITREK